MKELLFSAWFVLIIEPRIVTNHTSLVPSGVSIATVSFQGGGVLLGDLLAL